ncbi:MAG: 50S ribosomal protein L25 [Candidatus Omnitrophica bacterium]|nr:50S ribosomal protein L25 [Candidatus Omnitrophota bacterium]
MDQIHLKATIREGKGKEAAKKLRRAGQVPAVVYHRGEKPVSVAVVDKEISKILHAAGGENILISLTIEKEKKTRPRAVIIKEIQHDPVKRDILHVDFNEISLTEKITVEVEVVAQGEPVGVKQEGGILEHSLRELKIQCLPTDIPKSIDVEVSALKLNDSVHVRDLKLSEKIKILNDPDTLLFQVKFHEEKVEEAPVESPELEVIREKKEEETPGGGEKAAEKPAAAGKEDPKAKEIKPDKK